MAPFSTSAEGALNIFLTLVFVASSLDFTKFDDSLKTLGALKDFRDNDKQLASVDRGIEISSELLQHELLPTKSTTLQSASGVRCELSESLAMRTNV